MSKDHKPHAEHKPAHGHEHKQHVAAEATADAIIVAGDMDDNTFANITALAAQGNPEATRILLDAQKLNEQYRAAQSQAATPPVATVTAVGTENTLATAGATAPAGSTPVTATVTAEHKEHNASHGLHQQIASAVSTVAPSDASVRLQPDPKQELLSRFKVGTGPGLAV